MRRHQLNNFRTDSTSTNVSSSTTACNLVSLLLIEPLVSYCSVRSSLQPRFASVILGKMWTTDHRLSLNSCIPKIWGKPVGNILLRAVVELICLILTLFYWNALSKKVQVPTGNFALIFKLICEPLLECIYSWSHEFSQLNTLLNINVPISYNKKNLYLVSIRKPKKSYLYLYKVTLLILQCGKL